MHKWRPYSDAPLVVHGIMTSVVDSEGDLHEALSWVWATRWGGSLKSEVVNAPFAYRGRPEPFKNHIKHSWSFSTHLFGEDADLLHGKVLHGKHKPPVEVAFSCQ